MTIRNTGTGQCLAPQGESWDDGVPIVLADCNGSAFQRWDITDRGNHVVNIRNA